MANYLMKYKGTYRIKPNLDLEYNDVPRDENGCIDSSYDDIYIKCANGAQIYHYGRSTLCGYVPSIGRGHNILIGIAKEAEKSHAKEIQNLRINNAVESALMGAKALNPKAVKALLNLENAELDENGSVKGLDEQIKKLQTADDSKFMFGSSKLKGATVGEAGDESDTEMTIEKLRKMSPVDRHNYSVANPEAYKKLYGGN